MTSKLAGEPATILVVEDDPNVRHVTGRVLEARGYTVYTASHGDEALRLALLTDAPIDLLLTDVVMPGMSGPELAREFARNSPETRVLYLSGYPTEAISRHGLLDDGESAFLAKPFGTTRLIGKVREVLEGVPFAA
ncbi:MAG TPA: response regulator [Gemmatimonadales bacterium]|jgi:CheY-like chemotaxis protein